MKKRNWITIFLIILIVIIPLAIYLIVLNSKNAENKKIQIESNYYDYYNEQGMLKIDIKSYVKLPKNYKNIKNNSINLTISEIIDNSEINVPKEFIDTYKEEQHRMLYRTAEKKGIKLETYMMENYGVSSTDEYLDYYEKDYIDIIKKDMVYQALAKDLKIKISVEDVKQYYKELIENGETYESLKKNYGEKLLYKNTLEDKVNQKIK